MNGFITTLCRKIFGPSKIEIEKINVLKAVIVDMELDSHESLQSGKPLEKSLIGEEIGLGVFRYLGGREVFA